MLKNPKLFLENLTYRIYSIFVKNLPILWTGVFTSSGISTQTERSYRKYILFFVKFETFVDFFFNVVEGIFRKKVTMSSKGKDQVKKKILPQREKRVDY